MEIKCRINGKEYGAYLVQGHTFSEDYGEVLDSGSIILAHQHKIEDLNPYDDVWLYTNATSFGTTNYGLRGSYQLSSYYNVKNLTLNIKIDGGNYTSLMSMYKDGAIAGRFNVSETTGIVMSAYGAFSIEIVGDKVLLRTSDGRFYPFERQINGDYIASLRTTYVRSDEIVIRLGIINYKITTKITPDEFKVLLMDTLPARARFWALTASTGAILGDWNYSFAFNGNTYSYKVYFEKTSLGIALKVASTGGPDSFTLTKDTTSAELTAVNYFENPFSTIKNTENFDLSTKSLDVKYETGVVNSKTEEGKFYKHLLVDQFSEEIVNLEEGIYNYTIQLMSETKGLEVALCPNGSVTEPLKFSDKIPIYQYIAQYVYMYSPLIKVVDSEYSTKWMYKRKYTISEEVKTVFSNAFCQDFTLTNPTLRELLTELFKTLDLIPVVRDGVIYPYDKTKRVSWFHNCRGNDINVKGDFDFTEMKKYVNRITGSKSSDNFTDTLRRNHQNALTQYKSASTVECVGFRDRNNALLTLENLSIETAFPIYKIDSILMCYYKTAIYTKQSDGSEMYCPVLIKQDITPLVKLDSERNLLSQDWDSFNSANFVTIESLARYKMCTLGYNIGSNKISGFGTTYTYPQVDGLTVWQPTHTYIENIFDFMDKTYPFGCEDGYSVYQKFSGYNFSRFDASVGAVFKKTSEFGINLNDWSYNADAPENEDVDTDVDTEGTYNQTACLKSLFFEVDYQSFFNGTVIASKDGGRDCVEHFDNSTSALSLLEKDGIAQKEKINSLGNKAYVFTTRYTDLSQIQPLGSVFETPDESDIIIYHKEYSVFDNVISCTYLGAKDYVLKQFFTSVKAKHRPNKLMSYDESVNRAENRKVSILLSKKHLYYEDYSNSGISFTFPQLRKRFIDVFSDSEGTLNVTTGQLESSSKINYGIINYKSSYYIFDVNTFVCGKSICFNLRMVDNVASGSYITNLIPGTHIFNEDYRMTLKKYYKDDISGNWGKLIEGRIQDKGAYKGSLQDWYLMADENTGNGDVYNFIFAHSDGNITLPKFGNESDSLTSAKVEATKLIQKTLLYPQINEDVVKNLSYNMTVPVLFKDNKDVIDLTTQVEIMSDGDSEVFYSTEMCKLNDLVGIYFRKNDNAAVPAYLWGSIDLKFCTITDSLGIRDETTTVNIRVPSLTITVPSSIYNSLSTRHFHPEQFYDGISYVVIGGSQTITVAGLETIADADELKPFNDTQGINGSFHASYINGYSITPKKIEHYQIRHDSNHVERGLAVTCDMSFNVYEYDSTLLTWKPTTKTYQNAILKCEKTAGDTSNETSTIVCKGLMNTTTFHAYGGDSDYYSHYDLDIDWPSGTTAPIDGFLWTSKAMSSGEGDGSYNGNTNDGYYILVNQYPYQENEVTVYKTMQAIYSTESINQDMEYAEIAYTREGAFAAPLYPTASSVNSYFDVNETGINVRLHILRNELGEEVYSTVKSLQYWYWDSQSNSFKFVFGVNISDEERSKSTIKIFASVVRNRDRRVFDANMQPIGLTRDYGSNSGSFSNGQKYDQN